MRCIWEKFRDKKMAEKVCEIARYPGSDMTKDVRGQSKNEI